MVNNNARVTTMDPISSEAFHQFLVVAQEGDLNRAARRLGRDKTALCHTLSSIERALREPLLIVNPDRVILTGAGQALMISLGAVLRIQHTGYPPAGLALLTLPSPTASLRLGIPSAPLHPLLPRIFNAFRTTCPDIPLTLREASTDSQLRALNNGELDLCFVHRPDYPISGRLEPLVDETLCVVLPPGHPLLTLDTVALQLLASEGFIMPPPATADGFADRVMALCEQADFLPRVTHQAYQLPTIAGLVAAGLGVAIVPCQPDQPDPPGAHLRPITLAGRAGAARIPLMMAYPEHGDRALLHRFLVMARQLMPPSDRLHP